MGVFTLLALALAVSLDSFGVGLTYGLRKMKLPIKSLLFIASCSAVVIFISMGLGNVIQQWVSPEVAGSIGGVILIFIGLYALYQVFRKEKEVPTRQEPVIWNFEIKILGVVIRILRHPMSADLDDSGTISGREAFLLGMALSLDAFGAGLGAALLGVSPFLLAVSVAFMSAFFLTIGMRLGRRFSASGLMQRFSFIPGLLLIILGTSSLFG
ncbi:sporulation membrane protein YtaF [Alkalihalobacillus sp. 1P02AB]|uniref:sporulation membrane protein YtaF n=1 Tax=Alkalihalobacillus sp. 1P02AB TaxID=3132260 RepID=UPI0039A4F89D